eukprot:5302296-Amphidinium_carterae.1
MAWKRKLSMSLAGRHPHLSHQTPKLTTKAPTSTKGRGLDKLKRGELGDAWTCSACSFYNFVGRTVRWA